jgi:hypothetical protein
MSATKKQRLPEIIGIGPGRTATTWLHRVLEGHVDLPDRVKETKFFSRYYEKGIDWYAWHFRNATGEKKVVEICPYLYKREAPERIKTHIPNCRVITTLRDPVDTAFSVYKMITHYAWARGTFEEVLQSRADLAGGNQYASHLKKWFDLFGRENVLITMFDELRAEPQAYMNRVTGFMGIEPIALEARRDIGDDVNSFARAPRNRHLARNARKLMDWLQEHHAYGVSNMIERVGIYDYCYGRGELFARLTPEQEERLRKQYLPEVEQLEELLGIDLSSWKQPRARRAVEGARRAG